MKLDNENEVKSDEVVNGKAKLGIEVQERRKLFRRLVAMVAGLGITGVLLSQEKTGLLPRVQAADMVIDGVNVGAGTTELDSPTGNQTLIVKNTGAGNAIQADAGAAAAVYAVSNQYAVWGNGKNGGTGVYGRNDPSNANSGAGVIGYAGGNSGGPTGTTDNSGVYGQSDVAGVNGHGVTGYAKATSGSPVTRGVYGQADSSNGIGVHGWATGIGVVGQAWAPTSIPLVARSVPSQTQTANLQEWQDVSAGVVTVARVDSAGRFSSNAVNAEYRLVGKETNGRTWRLFSDGTSFNFTDGTANQNLAVFATDAVTFTRRLLPSGNGTLNLGLDGLRWNTVYCNTLNQTSLSSMKADIRDVSDIDYLNNVPAPIYYKLKNAPNDPTQLGFMGDELPEIAKSENGGVYLNAVIGILCGAVKQLELQNEQLLKRMDELESRAS